MSHTPTILEIVEVLPRDLYERIDLQENKSNSNAFNELKILKGLGSQS